MYNGQLHQHSGGVVGAVTVTVTPPPPGVREGMNVWSTQKQMSKMEKKKKKFFYLFRNNYLYHL